MSSWTFKIAEPGQEPRELEVRPGMTVGRNKQCSCVLKDDSASSRHIRVVEDGDALAIEDLGSTNGVRLESGSILIRGNRQRLLEGLRFWLGETEILVHEVKPTPPKPAAQAPPPKTKTPEDVEQTLARSPGPGKPRGATPPAPAKAPASEDAEQTLARSPIPGKPPGVSPAPRAPAPPPREAPAVMEEAPTLGGASPFRVGSGLAQPPRAPVAPPAEVEDAPTMGGASPFRMGSSSAGPSAPRSDPGLVEEAPTLSGPAPFRPEAGRGPATRPGPAQDPVEEAPTLGGGMQFAFKVGPEALSPPLQPGAPGGDEWFVLEGAGGSTEDGEMTMISAGARGAPPGPAPSRAEPEAPPSGDSSPAQPEASPPGGLPRPAPFEATRGSKASPESQASLEALDPRIVLVLSQFKRVVRIRSPEFVVGRGDDVDLDIVHPTISNRHAVIRFERGGFTIEDAGSKNGTFLEKTQLRENSRVDLRPESHVRFAAADALFIAKDPANPDGSLEGRAAKILVGRRKVTSAQVKSAASAGGHVGERLLLETDLQVSDWVAAMREASMRSSPRLGGKLLPIVLGAAAIIIIALLLVWLWK